MDNNVLLNKFYTAFQNRDAKTMNSCYHKDVVFKDPAFGILKGNRAKSMWAMLCKTGKDLEIKFSDIEVIDHNGKVNWEAEYTFSATKKKVHNVVYAEFVFKDGKIIEHIDTFSFKNWSSQAFGIIGKLFGNSAFFQRQFQERANRLLDEYIKKNGK